MASARKKSVQNTFRIGVLALALALLLAVGAACRSEEPSTEFTVGEVFGQTTYRRTVQDEWAPSDVWNLRLGVRTRYFEEGDRTFLEPRLGISHAVSEAVSVKLGAGLYNQVLQLVASEGFSGTDFYLPIDETTDPGRSLQPVS